MPKIVDHQQYRVELLSKSLPIFVSKGVASVSMRELSKELGVSTGTLYHYFPTKEALFTSMVKHLVSSDAEAILKLSEESTSIIDIMNFVAGKEGHFLNLMLLAVDVKRQLSDSTELIQLVDESFSAYESALNRFFPKETDGKGGKAFLSFFVGVLFLKSKGDEDTSWIELFEGLKYLGDLFSDSGKNSASSNL
ncbi:transcriptional regulator, TetR family [Leptospira yanagawae serovar Saopaulo str. Sao Paulo = ATCC 700523]|uniref:TetR/AcrR family transcriptional regulator n=2 Tax=Leptospira yanagawae TaxID=293069 RepID=A0ABY2LZX6_9LEPT|nr:TetR/AcrR family transcriptional regulator [Leptospira yanagawae]EOQ88674.1 transcriptional regulator, TetR family [Leptospira yanagawae serovar Saopaulo str. Sao Paulo = ATCC 700523]TGL19910.1 TetR/AcrR family transcriptional regulator [Leptospira yanagawae]